MKGFRTILWTIGSSAAVAGMQAAGTVDWSAHVGPVGAFVIANLIATGLRFITSTPVGGR